MKDITRKYNIVLLYTVMVDVTSCLRLLADSRLMKYQQQKKAHFDIMAANLTATLISSTDSVIEDITSNELSIQITLIYNHLFWYEQYYEILMSQ